MNLGMAAVLASKTWIGVMPTYVGWAIFDILVPLYAVEVLQQNVFYVGVLVMLGEATFIPASALWGYLCDRIGQYKVFVVLPLLLLGVITFRLPYDSDSYSLTFIYALISVLLSMFRPAVNLMIAESNPFSEWSQSVRFFTFVKGISSSAGLLLATLVSPHLSYVWLFTVIGALHLLSFTLCLIMIHEPQLKIERGVASISRNLDRVNESLDLAWLADNPSLSSYVLSEVSRLDVSFVRFLWGTTLFNLATDLIFTPMPVLLQQAFIESPNVFIVFFFNSLAGASTCLFIGRNAKFSVGGVKVSCLLRGVLVLMLIPFFTAPTEYSLTIVIFIIAFVGVMWVVFDASTNYMSLQLSPSGGFGIYFSLSKLGAVLGSIAGGFIAASYGSTALFVAGCIAFISALIAFLPMRDPHKP